MARAVEVVYDRALVKISDFRSDTVTRPSPAMRRAMADAPVGDDVFGDDPTVNELERRAAALVGHEAALFVPSGSMGNLAAIRVHCAPGEEAICESLSHVSTHEAAAAAAFMGVVLRVVEGQRGVMDPAAIARVARGSEDHAGARTGVVLVENTHNFAGGTILPLATLEATKKLCRERGIKLHLDGARLWNAAVATGKPATTWTQHVDSLMFCLSKGLGAPIGSLVCGSAEFVKRARGVRRALGGGMRQAGVIAAAGLVALEEGPALLAQDHARARKLAAGVGRIPGLRCEEPETNIVFVKSTPTTSHEEMQRRLEREGVLAFSVGDLGVRFVLHRDVGDEHVAHALSALEKAARP